MALPPYSRPAWSASDLLAVRVSIDENLPLVEVADTLSLNEVASESATEVSEGAKIVFFHSLLLLDRFGELAGERIHPISELLHVLSAFGDVGMQIHDQAKDQR